MLKPVIALTITDFKIFAKREELISRFIYKEETSNFEYTDNNIRLIFVELPKFTKEIEELETLADKWLYFLKYARSLTYIPEKMDTIPEIHQAFEIANQANLTREEMEEVERREMFIYDQQGAISLSKAEGKAEGKKEEKLEIARKSLALLDNETISQITGLTVDEVQNLRENSL
ncbi:MAG TPA: transposase, partial [Cyanobacteria bacterium UBA9226]|nr:transposase [Cyanobacteria bacterium UBA9226]